MRVFCVKVYPVVGQLPLARLVAVVERVRVQHDKFIFLHVKEIHSLRDMQDSLENKNQYEGVDVSARMDKAILVVQVAAGDVFDRIAGIGIVVEHGGSFLAGGSQRRVQRLLSVRKEAAGILFDGHSGLPVYPDKL